MIRAANVLTLAGVVTSAVVFALAPAAGCASRAAETAVGPSVVDAVLNEQRVTISFGELAARVPLAAGESFKIAEIGRDANSSHHIVALRGREPLHRHDRHDLLVVTLEGHGSMLIGSEERAVGPRSIVYVPRGAVHAMRNLSDSVLYGYAVFTPPFDGKDRVPVTQ
ncbi:MAG TPA: cupin domain-containing protein [Polyangiales bacterium]|nr:cupin domain-containing protein [Polyangiales bacterium]